jgi:hypothetical protein
MVSLIDTTTSTVIATTAVPAGSFPSAVEVRR